jgi:hypothetical protein
MHRGAIRSSARKALALQHDLARSGRGSVHPDEVFDLATRDAEPSEDPSPWGFPMSTWIGDKG